MRGVVLFVWCGWWSCCLGASNVNPVKIGNNAFTSRRNAVLLTAGLASAVGLKYYTDGPVFSEPVDLQGFNVVITGANTGLGKATAMKLAALHANVVMLVKTVSKGEAACEEIRSAVPGATVSALQIDLASLKSIAACSEELAKLLGKQGIDVLVNNAGVMAIPSRTTTEDGFETHLGVNHLGHFALTASLFRLLKKGGKGKGARIINVSSAAHTLGHLDFENLMFEREGSYQPWPAYGNSKLANVLFTRELDRRLRAKGSNIVAVSCHPGLCRTDLGRYLFDPASVPKYLAPLAGAALAPLVYATKSAEQGAQTQIFLSASSSVSLRDSGKYFDNSRAVSTSKEASDVDEARRLWQVSEKLVGRSFDV